MPEPKQTLEGLPVVTEDTLWSLNRDIQSGAFRLAEAYGRIEKDNPQIVDFVKALIADLPQPEKTLSRMIGVYELLRRQAESNQLYERSIR